MSSSVNCSLVKYLSHQKMSIFPFYIVGNKIDRFLFLTHITLYLYIITVLKLCIIHIIDETVYGYFKSSQLLIFLHSKRSYKNAG